MASERVRDRDWIAAYFKAKGKVGRFLDIGAYDGYGGSSLTYLLYEAGWSGVLVEPNPKWFQVMAAKLGNEPRLELVHAAITVTGGLVTFWGDDRGEVSTVDDKWRERFATGYNVPYSRYHVGSVTPVQLLDAFGGPRGWHFVSIDAEGVSIELALLLPLADMVDTEILVVEWDKICQPLHDQLVPRVAQWYDVERYDATNIIFKRKGV